MDSTTTTQKQSQQPALAFPLSFKGKGSEYFGIVIVNWLLTVVTLGLYYPWAKARQLQYLYGATEFYYSRFTFLGTGKEMFKGFIRAILIFTALYLIFFLLVFLRMPILAILELYLGVLALLPLAIHGSYKYRMSRTAWRSIRMGYRGDRNELMRLFFKGIFYTVITLGIYGAWFSMNLRNYVIRHIRFGNLKFDYRGKGSDYFVLNLKGYFLTLLTLGIYVFWWQRELFNYYIDNLSVHDEENGRKFSFRSTATGAEFFGLLAINFLLLVITLGLAYPWIVTRTLHFAFGHIEISGDINLDALSQTEGNYTDATGEDISDMLDFGFVI